jgi:hypothetical protein
MELHYSSRSCGCRRGEQQTDGSSSSTSEVECRNLPRPHHHGPLLRPLAIKQQSNWLFVFSQKKMLVAVRALGVTLVIIKVLVGLRNARQPDAHLQPEHKHFFLRKNKQPI